MIIMIKFIDLFAHLPSDYYSYLLSKTKAEKELLEFLGYQIENTTDYLSRVEYSNNEYGYSRMDLAVLDNKLILKEVVEAKFYYTFNGYRIHTQQLAKKSEVEKDVKKLRKVPNSVSKFFVLFLVHFESDEVPPLFPYFYTHNKTMKKFKSVGLNNSNLRSQSIETTVQFLKEKELEPEINEFEVGVYDKIPIILQVFTCPVN